MSGGIFISYRRNDNRHAVWHLFEKLQEAFPRDQVFMDVTSIEPGLDFKTVLKNKVESCDVLIAVIGKGWIGEMSRLADADDLCRLEIETALKRNIRVVPVLIDGTKMMGKEDLPASLHALVDRQAIAVSPSSFAVNVAKLIDILKKDVAARRKPWFGKSSKPQDVKPAPAAPPARVEAAEIASVDGERASRWPVVVAALLALSTPPLVLHVGRLAFIDAWLWFGVPFASYGADGMLVATAVVFVLAGLLSWLFPRSGGVFDALCWLSVVMASALTAGELLFAATTRVALDVPECSPVVVGHGAVAVLAGKSAYGRLRARGAQTGRWETILYVVGPGLGAALAACSAWPFFSSFEPVPATIGWVTGGLLALLVMGSLLRSRGITLGLAELMFYWIALAAVFANSAWELLSVDVQWLMVGSLASAFVVSALVLCRPRGRAAASG